MEQLIREIPCVLSGGTEGVMSPHYIVFCVGEHEAMLGHGAEPALGCRPSWHCCGALCMALGSMMAALDIGAVVDVLSDLGIAAAPQAAVHDASRIAALLVKCFFFNDTATTEIYTLSLHDALPI